MKKIIKMIIILIVFSISGYLGYYVVIKARDKNKIAEKLERIPKFELSRLDGVNFSEKNLNENLATIFIYYNSTCDFCQHEAENIVDNINEFNNVQFIFISAESKKNINEFAIKYKLNEISNITFLQDKEQVFAKKFGANFIPYNIIYNEKGKLLKRQKGQLNVKGILKALQRND